MGAIQHARSCNCLSGNSVDMVRRRCVACSLSLFILEHAKVMIRAEAFACDPRGAGSLTKSSVYRRLSGMPTEHHFFWSYFTERDTNAVVDVLSRAWPYSSGNRHHSLRWCVFFRLFKRCLHVVPTIVLIKVETSRRETKFLFGYLRRTRYGE